MEEKKTSIIALLLVLREYSDENHPLSQSEINNLMSTKYNVTLDRRTLYKSVETLIGLGYDISTFKDNGQGYYLVDRQFEQSEIYLLCNAIHSSNFIPSKASKDLINKLLQTQSKYYREDFVNSVFVDNANKKENKEFFLNIELLAKSIKDKKVISFNYTKYNLDRQIVNKREKPYVVSPLYLVYINEKTYLVAKDDNYNDLTHFRVDKIKNIRFIDKNYARITSKDDPYQYAKNKIYMYAGKENNIAIKCDNIILDDIIDKFGKNIMIYSSDDDHFIANIKSSKTGFIYFALQYLQYLEVLEPTELRKEIKDILNKGIKKYKWN